MRGISISRAALACSAGLLACTTTPPSPLNLEPPAAEKHSGWSYSARYDAGELHVDARFPAGTVGEFLVWRSGAPFVRELVGQTSDSVAWTPLEKRHGRWRLDCQRGCRLRWRFLVRVAVEQLGGWRGVDRIGDLAIISPSAWMVRPRQQPADARFTLRVTPSGENRFLTSYSGGGGDVWSGPLADLNRMPLSVLGPAKVERLAAKGAELVLVEPPEGAAHDRAGLEKWLDNGVDCVVGFYGRFPIRRALIVLRPASFAGIYHGSTYGHGGGMVKMHIGLDTTKKQFEDDWTLTHELIHLAFPNVERDHGWMEEGLSTYLEPLLRTRRGLLSERAFWKEMIEGMPNGLPEPGDRGFDVDARWGQWYWGGALFSLIADIEIRKASNNRRGLGDALRGVQAAGGDISQAWPLERVFAATERAIGAPIFERTYARMGQSAHDVDLDELWRSLGVSLSRGRVELDDEAPLAHIRAAITRAAPED